MRKSTAALLFFGLFGFFGLFAHGYLDNSDADVTMHAARALYLRGDSGLSVEHADASPAELALAAAINETKQYGMAGRHGEMYVWFPIGHVFLMVPCVVLGEELAEVFPEPERLLEAERGPIWGQFFWTRMLISFLSVGFSAGSAVVMFLIARALSLNTRAALLVMGVTALCTQFWPGTTESLSDVPGMFFLFVAVLGVFRYHLRQGAEWSLLLAGAAMGLAVLVRYQHAMFAPVLAASVFISARQQKPVLHPLLFCLGGLPFAILLGAVDYLRFGSIFETGYGDAAQGWFGYPPHIGAFKILFAAGKGIMWLSPLLWIALPQIGRVRGHLMTVTWTMFLIPVLLYSNTEGWSAGTCWGIRYLTPTVVLMVLVSLSLGRPWERRPRLFWALVATGFTISLSGHVAPVRGHSEMAHVAARTVHAEPLALGHFLDENLPDHFFSVPRYTPIRGHWVYAWLAATGRLETGGSENTTEPLFGVVVDRGPDEPVLRPSAWEDRGRHLWPFYLGALLGPVCWALVLLWMGLTAWSLVAAVGRLLVQDPHGMGR